MCQTLLCSKLVATCSIAFSPSPPPFPGQWRFRTTRRANRWRSPRGPTPPPTPSHPRRGSTWSRCTAPRRTKASSPARCASEKDFPKIITSRAFLVHRHVLQVERSLYKAGIASEWALAYSTGERACICAIAHSYLCKCPDVFVQSGDRCVCTCACFKYISLHTLHGRMCSHSDSCTWPLGQKPQTYPCELWKFWPSLKIY